MDTSKEMIRNNLEFNFADAILKIYNKPKSYMTQVPIFRAAPSQLNSRVMV